MVRHGMVRPLRIVDTIVDNIRRTVVNTRIVRIASMALRLLFVIQLVLGLLFWFGQAGGLVPLHMLVGLLFIVDVWFLGVVQGLRANGSIGLTVGTFVVGLLLAIVGMTQGALVAGG